MAEEVNTLLGCLQIFYREALGDKANGKLEHFVNLTKPEKMNMRTPPSLLDDEQQDSQPPENPGPEVDFSEYMWMGEELEEFDRQVEEELWEQAFIDACFEDMLAEEELHWYFSQLPHTSHSHSSGAVFSFPSDTAAPPLPHPIECKKDDMLKSSRLNPEAPEFVPKASKRVN